jgi:twitching motility protein PilT
MAIDYTIDDLLRLVAKAGASDLVVSAGTPPRLRINGQLEAVVAEPLNEDDVEQLIRDIITPDELEDLETNRSIDFSRQFEGMARVRFNVFHQRDVLSLAARPVALTIPGFEELGLPPIMEELAMRPHGLILTTGPAGSGKSTTQAAMIDYINTNRKVHVVSIEDPIEYLHPHRSSVVDQREVGTDTRSIAEALRSVFRQTPDVIMVGEMRDLETVQLVLTLAETGHLILGTLHTQDTTHSVSRIVDMFPANQQSQIYAQLSMVLKAVVSQQLLPTIEGDRRVLAYELMVVTSALRNLIREGELQQIYGVLQTGRTHGMRTMNESLLELSSAGLIDRDLALERSPHPKELKNMLEYQINHSGKKK